MRFETHWTAPGPVDSEEAKPSGGEAVDVVVSVRDHLVRLLRGSVQASRPVISHIEIRISSAIKGFQTIPRL